MVAFEHNARPAYHCIFQHIICFFARAIQIGASLDRPAQELMQAHSWEAYRIFHYVDTFFSVEGLHLFQSLQAWSYVKVVVVHVAQPVCKDFLPLF